MRTKTHNKQMYNVGEYFYDTDNTNLYVILEVFESVEQIKYYDYLLQNVETKETQQVMESWINKNLTSIYDVKNDIDSKENKIKELGEEVRMLRLTMWECIKKLKKVGINYE